MSRLPKYVTLIVLLLLTTACSKGEAGDPARGETLHKQSTIGPNNAPGCATCHSLEPGKVILGPSHANIASQASEVIQDPKYQGNAKTVEEFLRESIIAPDVYTEEGFAPGVMYPKYGEDLSEQEMADLAAYLMTLK